MGHDPLTSAGRPSGVHELLLLAQDEADVLARARRLLVPVVGDELALVGREVPPEAVTQRAGEAQPESPSLEMPSSLPWPPGEGSEQRPGQVWFAPGAEGGWTKLEGPENTVRSEPCWLAARLGGTPSPGWVLLKRSSDRPPFSRDELDLLREAATAAGFALVAATTASRLRLARAVADAATHRWAALAHTNALLVRSPDYEETVDAVLEAVVPYLADWALLELVDADGHVERRAGRHTHRERDPLLAELRSFPRQEAEEGATAACIPPEGLLIPDVGDEDLCSLADPEDLEALRALAPRSLAVVPLCVGDRMLGTLTLASAESGQVFRPDDLALSLSVAQHAALALNSAEMYRAAERARQEREEILAMVSHDLKNPLNTVDFAVTILGTPEVPEKRRNAQLKVIRRAVGEMNELIERLLDAARIDSGRFHVDPSPEPLDELVREALGRAAATAKQAGVRWALPRPTDATVLADRGRLLQVFANLLNNAISFSPPGGKVSVAVDLAPGECRIEIRDEGQGMDDETQQHIFDRYWQARHTGRAGTGLGLTIARGIVEAHGGRIGVESRPGHGSTFHFTIPRVTERPAADSRAPHHANATREKWGTK